MANRTTECGIIARCRMAVGTFIPGLLVFAAVNGEIHRIMVKSGRFPGGFAMAAGAVRRELCGFMIGIGGLVVIVDMTAGTGIRGVIVVAFMAGGAGIGNSGMRAFQGVIIVVNGKGGRLPGISGMTGGAVCWNSQRHVVGVGTLVIIRRMATCAVRRCAGVA